MILSDIQFIFLLLIIFQLKHFLGDYVFQTAWMVKGKSIPGLGFVFPLSVHVFIHASLTLVIVIIVDISLWYLFLFDFVAHFVLDRLKSGPRYFGRFTDFNKQSFWIPFGFDQMGHHLTHYTIILWIYLHRF